LEYTQSKRIAIRNAEGSSTRSSLVNLRAKHVRAVSLPLHFLSFFFLFLAFSSKNSSFGWDPVEKRKEIFHSLSRFIVVHDDEEDVLLAYIMFRFEHENDEDLVYWYVPLIIFSGRFTFYPWKSYEVQVAASAQGKGLGKKLLNDLEKIGKGFNMEKIMLTILTCM